MPAKLYYNGMIVDYEKPAQHKKITEQNYERNNERTYSIKFNDKHKIISSAFKLWTICPAGAHSMFITNTFRYGDHRNAKDTNEVIKRFTDNMRKNYNWTAYIWTRELTEQGADHYHIIFNSPYNEITKINRAWCNARGYYSPNAVRTDKRNGLVIRNVGHCAGYASKYAAKSKGQKFKTRAYGMTNNIQVQPITLHDEDLINKLYDERVPFNKYTKKDVNFLKYRIYYRIPHNLARQVYKSYL